MKTMKKIILLLLGFYSIQCFSQTTNEEYNYMTNGFVIQLRSGQDLNRGYRIEKIGVLNIGIYTDSNAKRSSEFFKVYNENSSMPNVPIGTILKMNRTDGFNEQLNNVIFFMPNKYSNSEVLTKAYQTYIKLFKTTTMNRTQPVEDYTWNMMQMISVLTSK